MKIRHGAGTRFWRSAGTVALLIGLSASGMAGPSADATLSAAEQRGKRVFMEGDSATGAPIMAVVSRGSAPIPASILPCASCHGKDGYGRPEGGVTPPDITWPSLTMRHGHTHEFGRSHPAFDESSVAMAIRAGTDSAGNALDLAMPRYTMSEEDMTDLIAYLKKIRSDLDPGLTADTISVGTLLPVGGELASLGSAMRGVLEAVFADVNANGGVYGRRIELTVTEYNDDIQESLWRMRDLLRSESVFAVVGSYGFGIERNLADLAEEREIPMIGPYTPFPQPRESGERHSFYLTGGLMEQAQVLARHAQAIEGIDGTAFAIVHVAGQPYGAAVDGIRTELGELGLQAATEIEFRQDRFDAAAIAGELVAAATSDVFALAPAELVAELTNELARRGIRANVFLPGMFAGSPIFDIDADFSGRLFVAYSTIPDDHTPEGVREFESLHARHGLGYEHSGAQISSFVAAQVFLEALKRAGRDLSREKLLNALESLSDFHSELMPPLSFGRRQRIGAHGGYVLEADVVEKKFTTRSDWISLRY